MKYATEYIFNTLKAARKSKGLSQRELGKRSGIPQGHISKIEKNAVDIGLSSLIALARALDLELMLVPRTLLPAAKSIVRSSVRLDDRQNESSDREIDQIPQTDQDRSAYDLYEETDE